MDAKISKNINELTRNREEFEKFYETLSFEEREELDSAQDLGDFAKALNKHEELTPQEVDQLFEFRKDKITLEEQQNTQTALKKNVGAEKKETRQEQSEGHGSQDHEGDSAESDTELESKNQSSPKPPESKNEAELKNPEKIHRPKDSMSADEVEESLKKVEKPTEEISEGGIVIPSGSRKEERKQKAALPTEQSSQTQTTNLATRRITVPTRSIKQKTRSSFPGRPGGPRSVKRRSLAAVGKLGKRGLKRGSKKAAMAAGRALFTNPYVLLGIGVVVGVIIVLFLAIAIIQDTCDRFSDPVRFLQESIADPDGMALRAPLWGVLALTNMCPTRLYDANVPPNPPGIITEKTGPLEVDNGENITYTVTVTYDPYADNAISFDEFSNMSLFDVPAFNFNLVRTTGVLTDNPDAEADDYMQYAFEDNQECLTEYTCSFDVTVVSPGSDFIAVNTIYVAEDYSPVEISFNTDLEGAGGSGGSSGGGVSTGSLTEGRNSPPSNRTCDGEYRITATKKNFGDPVCSYTPAKFSAYLREIAKPKNVEFWEAISKTEGSDDRVGGNLNRGSASGWGTFQMGPKRDTMHTHGPGNWSFKPYWDHGDVPWQRQIEFAVARNDYWDKNFNANFMYWGTAYCLCYFEDFRDKNGWCEDIRRTQSVRCPEKCFSGAAYCNEDTDRVGSGGKPINCSAHACYTGIGDSRINRNVSKGW